MAGHLHFLWWWCMDYALDGDLSKYTNQQIADASEWDADATEYVNALVESGFLDRTEIGCKIHDWLDFCGTLVKKRLARKEEKRKETGDIVDRLHPKTSEVVPTVPNRTVPNRTVPNRTEPNKKRVGFTPPTKNEVEDYGTSINFTLDAQSFLDYYATRGWKLGRTPMKDWRAAVRTWKNREAKDTATKEATHAQPLPAAARLTLERRHASRQLGAPKP
jgi:hypothetical protein